MAWRIPRSSHLAPASRARGQGQRSQSPANSLASAGGSAAAEAPGAPDPKAPKTAAAGAAKRKADVEEGEPQQAGAGYKDSELMTVVLKTILQLCQNNRHMSSCMWTTFLVPIVWKAVLEGKAEAKSYQKAVEDQGKGHTLGPPHPHILRAFVGGAAAEMREKMNAEVTVMIDDSTENKEATMAELEAFCKVMDAEVHPRDIALKIPYFRIKEAFSTKTEDSDKLAIITWCFADRNSKEEKALNLACEAAGGARQIGPAPRGAMERILELALTKKGSGKGKHKKK